MGLLYFRHKAKIDSGLTRGGQLIGRTLSHYRIEAAIGAGGMGEVYRATDTKLGREVALKLLPEAFSQDAERLARFKREAQLLASLNHPFIASIYGLEDADGIRALVMELVEGPTLADRIAQGAIPPDEALPIARQIADGLEYAHERGIVHRDLKPANIKITHEGTVKILDFGLAKALGTDEQGRDISNSPTLSLAMTQAGLIIGTASYMAPEQAKGKPVDRRADIWAFGCVLYEMLAGRKAFVGETVSDILAAVLRSDPDWSALPPTTPASIQRLLRRCLVKDQKQRLRDMGDARIAIEESLSGADAQAAISESRAPEVARASLLRRAVPWALAATTIVFASVAAWLVFQPKPPQAAVRFAVPSPENETFPYGGESALSPDGRTLAFITQARPDKPYVLWVRPLDSLMAVPIQGTEGAEAPFWSPDSQQIGFYAGGKLQKIALTGGLPQTLCETNDTAGADWNRDGVILFANQNSLYRVPDTGGTPTLVVAPNSARHETAYRSPQFLPDGRHFLFQSSTGNPAGRFIGIGSLDSKSVVELMNSNSNGLYAAPGYIFYLNQGTLVARAFDAKALRFTGPSVPVAANVGMSGGGYAYFSVSATGVLAYGGKLGTATSQMSWLDREGQNVGTVGQPDIYTDPMLSPDGTELAVSVGTRSKRQIWIFDTKRGTASRLTFDPADDAFPTWSSDGASILFSSTLNSEDFDIFQKAANGLGATKPILETKNQTKGMDDVSPDGRYALYVWVTGANTAELWALPLFGERKPFAFVQGSFGAYSARFSPNGRYVAYESNETGRFEIYVETFPQPAGRWQISATGGEEPTWRRDGKEMFYLTPDKKLMAVPVSTDSASFQAGIPKQLFQAQLISDTNARNTYAASPDGQRFLMLVPAGEPKTVPITVVVNWQALLKK